MITVLLILYLATANAVRQPVDPPQNYKYFYDIGDPSTGDFKSQHETREGDVVRGSYSVLDPDGTKRTVQYTADPHNGFNAVVHTEPATPPKQPIVYAPEAPKQPLYIPEQLSPSNFDYTPEQIQPSKQHTASAPVYQIQTAHASTFSNKMAARDFPAIRTRVPYAQTNYDSGYYEDPGESQSVYTEKSYDKPNHVPARPLLFVPAESRDPRRSVKPVMNGPLFHPSAGYIRHLPLTYY